MNPKALYQLTYGLFVLTAHADGRDNGCIVNTAMQIANNPTRVSVAVIKGNLTHDMIAKTGVFNVSTLAKSAPFALFQLFGMQSGRDVDKFDGLAGVKRAENGLLYLTEDVCMMLSCRVVQTLDLGSHTLFVGELTEAEVLGGGEPCTYAFYQSDIKPKKKAKTGWVCSVCGYVYEGDVLPEDYLCPICKHGPEVFQRLGEEQAPEQKAPEQKASEQKASEPKAPETAATKWVCSVCGYVWEGEQPPEICPVCKVPADRFVRQG